jgi:hypothetical protein
MGWQVVDRGLSLGRGNDCLFVGGFGSFYTGFFYMKGFVLVILVFYLGYFCLELQRLWSSG